MKAPRHEPPRYLGRVLRWLFPGPRGAEAYHELEQEYTIVRERHIGLVAWLWYVGQLFRPSTWMLARELRSQRRDEVGEAGIPLHGTGSRLGISWLDVKLGLRMLAKYPVMTIVSGLAIAVTIAVAVGTFSVFQDFLLRPTLPLSEGDRVVSLGLRTVDTNRPIRGLLQDYIAWSDGLETVEQLSIWRAETRNIITSDGRGELAYFAMMSAAGFEVARVPPLLGRPLQADDEIEGAPPVVVIGYDEWVNRFGGDPEIVGRGVRIGSDMHTIVGVMPEGFTFPYSERMWLPFTDDPDNPQTRARRYFVFGRLAPGVTLAQAEAEVVVLTSRGASANPDRRAQRRGHVMPYTDPHTEMEGATDRQILLIRLFLGIISLVVLIPFANVAILMYARTATRAGEIAVRNALGASRRRVVAQLFAEAMVLASLSAAAGVGIALFTLARVEHFMDTYFGVGMPFWAKNGQDPWVVAYAAGLTILAAVVAGVVPGLQATGKGVHANLRRAVGGNSMRLGKVWTGLVVTQVAITVACLPIAGWIGWQAMGIGMSRAAFETDPYMEARIAGPALGDTEYMDQASRRDASVSIEEVVRRLEADPRVTGVVLSSRPPVELFSIGYSDFARLDIDGIELPVDQRGHPVGDMAVDPGFFDFLGVPVEAGREFGPTDLGAEPQPVVVNRAFVERILGGANPIGRYIRSFRGADEEPAPWREIIGVVGELAENPLRPDQAEARIFTPFDRSRMLSAYLTVHAPSGPADLVPVVRRTVTAVDPDLRLYDASPLSEPSDPVRAGMQMASAGIGLVLLSVLLLCTAGVFSLMSFNVTQRQREIGIRSALGASPHRVLASVMARSAKQLSIGVVVGFLVVVIVPPFSLDGAPIDRDPRLLVAVAALMMVVGLLAAAAPARAGLRIQPTEALKEG